MAVCLLEELGEMLACSREEEEQLERAMKSEDFEALRELRLRCCQEEDPENTLGESLVPTALPECASPIKDRGDRASTRKTECEDLLNEGQQELGKFVMQVESGSVQDEQGTLSTLRETGVQKVRGTKERLARFLNPPAISDLLVEGGKTQEEVDAMSGKEKEASFKRMEFECRQEHAKAAKEYAQSLLDHSGRPMQHDKIHAKASLAQQLREMAAETSAEAKKSKQEYEYLCKFAESLAADQEAAKQRRYDVMSLEVDLREQVQEAVRKLKSLCQEHQRAHIENEQLHLVTEALKKAKDDAEEEKKQASKAMETAQILCDQCVDKANECATLLAESVQTSDMKLLAHTTPAVKEAWQNAAIGHEVSLRLVAGQEGKIDRLCQEKTLIEQRLAELEASASNSRRLEVAQKKEEAKKLEKEIEDSTSELRSLQALAQKLWDQRSSLRELGLAAALDEDEIARRAEEQVESCYGVVDLGASESDPDVVVEERPWDGSSTAALALQNSSATNPLEALRAEFERKQELERESWEMEKRRLERLEIRRAEEMEAIREDWREDREQMQNRMEQLERRLLEVMSQQREVSDVGSLSSFHMVNREDTAAPERQADGSDTSEVVEAEE